MINEQITLEEISEHVGPIQLYAQPEDITLNTIFKQELGIADLADEDIGIGVAEHPLASYFKYQTSFIVKSYNVPSYNVVLLHQPTNPLEYEDARNQIRARLKEIREGIDESGRGFQEFLDSI